LARLFKVWEHDPFFALDGIELTGVQALDEWPSSFAVFSVGHTTEYVEVVSKQMDCVVSSGVEHVVKRLKNASILVQDPSFLQESFIGGVVAAHHVEMALLSESIPGELRDILFVLNHECLSHVIQNFIGVDELGFRLEIENSREHLGLEVIFHLEVTGEVEGEETAQLLLEVFRTSAA